MTTKQCNITNCPLWDAPIVLGEGPDKADVCIVGEGPGAVEAKKGRPFVGPSGQLLNRVLKALGAERESLWITNSALCRGKSEERKSAAARYCRPRLLEELASKKPKVILTLGNIPTRVLIGGTGGITKRRGRATWVGGEGSCLQAWVIPTLHPAGILRRAHGFTDFVADLRKAFEVFRVAHPWHAVPNEVRYKPQGFGYKVVSDPIDALWLLWEEAMEQRSVVFDLETSGFDRRRDRILCMVLCWSPDQSYVLTENVLNDPNVREALQLLMDRQGEHPPMWIGHSAKFDAGFMLAQYGWRPQIGYDTLLANYTMDERGGVHDLKVLSATKLDAPEWEGDLKNYLKKPRKDSYALLPKDVLHRYSAHDGVYTYRLWKHQEEKLNADSRRVLEELLLPAANAIVASEDHGILVDRKYLGDLEEGYHADLFDLEVTLGEMTRNPEFNPNSPKQVAHMFFDVLKLPQIKGRSTDKGVIAVLAPLHPLPTKIKAYRHATKMLSTYVVGVRKLLDADDRVHPSNMLHGTVTGRPACRGPNMLNIPRGSKLRSMFIAPPGYKLLYPDYNQAELRTLGLLAGDEWMAEVYKGRRDLHSEVATAMFGPTFTKEQRMIAKMINFGIAYGRSAYELSRDPTTTMSVAEAQAYINAWFRRMPQVEQWLSATRKTAFRDGVLKTVFGRRRRFPLVTNSNVNEIRNQAVNFPVQSTAADLTLTAFIRLSEIFENTDVHVVIPSIYDGMLLEVPEAQVDDVASTCKEVMEQVPREVLGTFLPFTVDVGVGDSWGALEKWQR